MYSMRCGLKAQKPTFRAYEQSPRKVRKWLKEEYPAIKRKAQKQRGMVFWPDEAGMRSRHQAGTTFAPKGKTPVLHRTGQRFSLHMISALSNPGRLIFVVVDGKFNGAVFLQFLDKLIKAATHKVFLIADSHPVHLEKKVGQWLEGHKGKIELFFLPTYSPALNPDEYFNQDLKTNAVGRTSPRNKEQLIQVVEAFSKGRMRNPQKVIKYFHAKAVRYAI